MSVEDNNNKNIVVIRRWDEMQTDILVKIFQNLEKLKFDEVSSSSSTLFVVSHVCERWRMAASDPLLWKTLDLSSLRSLFIKVTVPPFVYVHTQSDRTFTRLFKIALNLSRQNIHTLIFHYHLFLTDDNFTYAAQRCPGLKRLVIPSWNRIKKTGMCRAIRTWEDLESLTMPSISDPEYLMEQISESCKKFVQLKVMGPCDVHFASTLAAFLPNLKVLSLRCTLLLKEALIIILDGLPRLRVLNISHCLLVEVEEPPPPTPTIQRYLQALDHSILDKASRLKTFLTCTTDSCTMCHRVKMDMGLMRWERYEENLWREDEVTSLAI